MPTKSTLERLYSLSELEAAGFGGRSTLYRAVREGRIPAVRVGKSVRVRESDLPKILVPITADLHVDAD